MQVPTNADFRSLSDVGTVLHERTLKCDFDNVVATVYAAVATVYAAVSTVYAAVATV